MHFVINISYNAISGAFFPDVAFSSLGPLSTRLDSIQEHWFSYDKRTAKSVVSWNSKNTAVKGVKGVLAGETKQLVSASNAFSVALFLMRSLPMPDFSLCRPMRGSFTPYLFIYIEKSNHVRKKIKEQYYTFITIHELPTPSYSHTASKATLVRPLRLSNALLWIFSGSNYVYLDVYLTLPL